MNDDEFEEWFKETDNKSLKKGDCYRNRYWIIALDINLVFN